MKDTSEDLTGALRDAERRLQAAQLAGDADVLDDLLDDRLIYIGGPDGARHSKQDDLEIQRSRTQRLSKVEEEELIVFVEGHTGVPGSSARWKAPSEAPLSTPV
jgi:hypothetical protein